MVIKNYELLILIGISFILSSLQINLFCNILAMYIVCFVISYRCYQDVNISLKYSVFLTIVFSILKIILNANNKLYKNKSNNIVTENFEDDTNKKEKEIVPDIALNQLQLDNDENTLDDSEEETLNKYLSKLNNEDEKHDKNIDVKDMSPAHAQRELFRLIDTTSLLKKTMTEMTPVLNEGKKIMKSIEALNLVS